MIYAPADIKNVVDFERKHGQSLVVRTRDLQGLQTIAKATELLAADLTMRERCPVCYLPQRWSGRKHLPTCQLQKLVLLLKAFGQLESETA